MSFTHKNEQHFRAGDTGGFGRAMTPPPPPPTLSFAQLFCVEKRKKKNKGKKEEFQSRNY